MSAATLPRSNGYDDEGLGRPLVLAVGLHLLLALFLWLSAWLKWDHDVVSAAGSTIEATMETTAAEDRAVARAMNAEPVPLPPEPEPVVEETAPPPQPLPEPAPQDSPVQQQVQAQEQIPVPDEIDQEEARREAISQEKALKEQEEKRRQEQIDLTERQRQQEAEEKRRLAQQQAEAKAKDERLKQLRAERAKLDKQMALDKQRLQQLAQAQARMASNSASSAQSAGQPAEAAGSASGPSQGDWVGAMLAEIERQWVRPPNVNAGQICPIRIKMLPGGEVMSAEVQSNCPYDEAARDSVERAVLKASPLPYRGFEKVAARDFVVRFQPSR